MAFLIGVILAIAVGIMAFVVGFDRDRAFYSAVLMVVASYYALFAVMGGSMHALTVECAAATVFLVASIAGFRTTMWWAVAGLAGHGLFDFVHGHLVANPGMPAFWPAFCGAYDVTAAGFLAFRLAFRAPRGAGEAKPPFP